MNLDLSLGALTPWLVSAGLALGAALLGLIVHRIVFGIAARLTRHTGSTIDDSLVRHARRPARLLVPLLVLGATVPSMPLDAAVRAPFHHAVWLGLIASVAWLLTTLTGVVQDVIAARYDIATRDNLTARRVETQFRILRRVIGLVVAVLALGIMLMTFPEIRQIGTSVLASAGVAGLVVGLAARSTLSSLIAGVQLALTEPIRIDDVVIIEGEWGWIEEITMTYVIVRIWDLRRLVVPLSYFLDHPFQNWTRQTADLLGSTFVYADYTVPVDALREALHGILKESGMWDGKTWGLQVTDASDRTLELRALMSAPDSGTAWDLRCHVREKLVAFLRERYPESLPRVRARVEGMRAAAPATGNP